jgi:ABC-type multidrug transport system fused ATPase/permease subunit
MLHRLAGKPSVNTLFDICRIINRFAKELSLVDALLPIQMAQLINSIFSLFGVFAAMMFGSVYVVIAIVPAICFYLWFQNRYRHTSVELQRLEALSRAPILSHLSETMCKRLFSSTLIIVAAGVSSIRAYKMEDTFKNMNAWKVNYNTAELVALRFCASYVVIRKLCDTISWFGLCLDFTGQFLVLATFLAITLTRLVKQFSYSERVGYTQTLEQLMSAMLLWV